MSMLELEHLAGKKVLVTGAGGFIGSHLVEQLIKLGASVTALVKYNSQNDVGNLKYLPSAIMSKVRVQLGNIEDYRLLDEVIAGRDYVFNLAALIGIPYSYIAPISYIRTNVEGTVNVLEACRRHKVGRLLQTSTSEVYGSAIYSPIDEKHPLQGQSPYSASKISSDKMAESYFKSFDLPVITVRPFNTYGPRQSQRAVLPTIITQALYADEIRLGSLDTVRDMNFVTDTVDGFLRCAVATGIEGSTINIGSGTCLSVQEMVNEVQSALGTQKRIVVTEDRVRPSKSEVTLLLCDNGQAREKLDWRAKVSFKQGVQETIDFTKKYGIAPNGSYVV